jgi:aquaglyceroporin related protein
MATIQDPPLTHDWAHEYAHGNLSAYRSATSTTPLTHAPTEHSFHSSDLTTDRTSSSLTHSRSIIGLNPQAPVDEAHDHPPRSNLLWSRIRAVLREPFAEFWGVAIMVMFGDGAVAQVLLSAGQASAPGGNGYGSYQSINWGYAESPPSPISPPNSAAVLVRNSLLTPLPIDGA